jgi:hypothetical protein
MNSQFVLQHHHIAGMAGDYTNPSSEEVVTWETSCLLWNLKVNFCVHNSLPIKFSHNQALFQYCYHICNCFQNSFLPSDFQSNNFYALFVSIVLEEGDTPKCNLIN